MAVKQVNGTKFYKDTAGKRGTILLGGNISNTSKWQARNVIGTRSENYGQAEPGDRTDIKKAVTAGTFNVLDRTKWIAMKVTTTLGGVANKSIQSGAGDFGNRKLAFITRDRQNFLDTVSWTSDVDGMPTYTFTYATSNTSFGNDVEASATYTAPGKNWFSLGAMPPKETAYGKKTIV